MTPIAGHRGSVVRQLLCPECLAIIAPALKQPSMRNRAKAEYDLRRNYGIDANDYETLLFAQGGRCQICRKPPGDTIRLSVDHNHESGAVRGLLCNECNVGIGMLGDNSKRLLRAAAYVAGVLTLP